MATLRHSLRPYTGAPAAVSRDARAFAHPAAHKRNAHAPIEKPKRARRSSRAFLAALLAITGGWIFAAANPGNLSAVAARVTGLAMGYATPGVEIVRTAARRSVSDGQTILYVDGTLANKAASPQKPPRLIITIVGEDDQPLYTWTSRIAQSRIEAAGQASFQARLMSPPDTFKSIKVALAKEG